MAGDAGGVTTLAPSAASRSRLRLRDIGPGAVIAAAFIGPGTVTTATLRTRRSRAPGTATRFSGPSVFP